eukprot:gene2605-50471_t
MTECAEYAEMVKAKRGANDAYQAPATVELIERAVSVLSSPILQVPPGTDAITCIVICPDTGHNDGQVCVHLAEGVRLKGPETRELAKR